MTILYSPRGHTAGFHWVWSSPELIHQEETQVQFLGPEDPLEEGMIIHSSILAWRIPWTAEPGGLQSTGSQEWDTT